jgi:nucleoside-diphosphate-sugar epimerase
MHSILDLAFTIGGLLGVAVDPRFETGRAGEVRFSCADVSKFAAQAGFKAQMHLREGVAATIS